MIVSKKIKRNKFEIMKIQKQIKKQFKIKNKDNGKSEHLYYQSYTIQSKKREKYARNASIKIHFLGKIVRNVILNMEAK
jgi:hypothetical protein